MVKELLLRMCIGGLMVSAFAAIGDVLKPKRFAGIFAAAPSVALATLALTVAKNGSSYAAIEARSMVAGAVGLLVYAFCVCRVMIRYKLPVPLVTSLLIVVWVGTVFGIWVAWLR
jgi:hypothetical protein